MRFAYENWNKHSETVVGKVNRLATSFSGLAKANCPTKSRSGPATMTENPPDGDQREADRK